MNKPPDWAATAGETTLGAAILFVRRLNIVRDEDHPVADLIDVWLETLGAAIPAASATMEEVLGALAARAPEDLGEVLRRGEDLAGMAPDLVRIAGLRRRVEPDA